MNKFKVIIIDDERLARQELKHILRPYTDFEIFGEASNADEGRQLIVASNPDVIFLDIQMPEQNGFDLLESLDKVPEVVFTTAFNEYAVQAFEANALDYLVKPMRTERFELAIKKVRTKLSAAAVENQVFIKDGNQCLFLRWKEVYLIESMNNYAALYHGNKKTYIKRSLNQLEEKLDSSIFFRINRKQLINTQYIQQVVTTPANKLKISLRTGDSFEVSIRQSVLFKGRNRL